MEHLVPVHRGERLILVRQVRQVRGCRTHIGQFENQIGEQRLLNTKTPLLYSRCLQVWIDDEHRRLNDGLRGIREDLVHHRKISLADKIGSAWSIARKIKPGIRIHRRIKNSRAAAESRFCRVRNRATRKSKARRKIRLVREHQVVTKPVISHKRQKGWRIRVRIKLHVGKSL